MLKQADVIIIGAGIAGSSCAIQLARLGHKTVLLDRQHFPRHKTCGEFMSPETKEMLDYLGVNPETHGFATGTMDRAKLIFSHGGEIEAPLPGRAVGISRYELDRLLHQQASEAGTEISTKTRVTGIEQMESGLYEVCTRQGKDQVRYLAKAVIAAYGTKRPTGAPRSEIQRDKTAYVGVKSHFSGLHIPSQVELYFCEGGYVGLSPIENGIVNAAALLSLDVVQRLGKSVPEILEGASRTNSKLADRLSKGTPVAGTQVSVAPLHLSDVPEPWSQFPHVGDAMLMIPPLCGDGMSIALRSAWLCARSTDQFLRGNLSFSEWKNQYTEEANREFSQLLRRARTMHKLAFAKTNRLYPGIARLLPGLASYLVKSTRLSETGLIR
ncbi:NAD(P)/FAD-dependent oxidoreductase [Paenibacillus zeisoli]|uniref:NAD(P)/FAD-dependent oxidoreductase n=1 Tax=Paenibacillus zeisoli TaxID=2496267 RepID=A0A3S1DDB7_9BACL|nr:NAD(P)/FAD-dependent oxidoreductase [Paenibacillus zeisoli]RUT35731.1 NAD(P)/FAD-dependent oxidoreductase [Paenibacillus zeisoli]